jgi:hypothetical protein
MVEFITLYEIYVHNPKLFKNKNLKSFIKLNDISDNDVCTSIDGRSKGNIGISKKWIKKNLPTLSLTIPSIDSDFLKVSGTGLMAGAGLRSQSGNHYFEAQTTLAKYGVKKFNPTIFNFDFTSVEYFLKDNQRTPYLTRKGLHKLMIIYNDIPDQVYSWIDELIDGGLQSHHLNLPNVVEMVNTVCIPAMREVDGKMILKQGVYSLERSDVLVDFRRIADLKTDNGSVQHKLDEYKCPVFAQLQTMHEQIVREAEQRLKQEKKIQRLEQELEMEKSLKNQVLSLTQSFVPHCVVQSPPFPETRRTSPTLRPPGSEGGVPNAATLRPQGSEAKSPRVGKTPVRVEGLCIKPSKM